MYRYPHSLSAFFITKVNFKGIDFSYAFKVDFCYKKVKKIHSSLLIIKRKGRRRDGSLPV